MLKYKIKAQGNVKAAAEIHIYGDIGESWWEETTSAKDFVKELAGVKNEEITVRINSAGGSVPDGVAIYNALRRHPAAVTVAIDGIAYSIASLIAMAGDTVEMAENALLMIHAPWTYAAGNSKELREYADMLDTWASAMATSYAAKSGKTVDEISALLMDGDDHYYTAAEAQDEGFVDSLVEALPIAASRRIPAASMERFSQAPSPINQFVIKAARAASKSGDQKMNVAQKIKAAFQAHMGQPGVDELLSECLADDSITLEDAQARLQAHVSASSISQEPVAEASADSARARAEGAAAEASRRDEIEALFTPFSSNASTHPIMKACMKDPKVTVEAARTQLLNALGSQSEPVAGAHHTDTTRMSHGISGHQQFREDAVAAILARAGSTNADVRSHAAKSPLRHASLLDLAKASLERSGFSYSMMDSMQVVGAAITQSTSDFPVLLETAMHKAMLDAYATAPDTWSRFCRSGSVSDFRAHGRFRTGSIGNFNVVNEDGEFENKAIPDGEKGTITIDTRGALINLSRKMIVNDDLGAFIGVASAAGRAGRRTIEAAVYSLLGENAGLGPTMPDTNPLFHTSRNNVGTGAALSSASIEADRVVMGSQTDIGANEFLDLRPAIWLGPLALGGTARVINDAQYDPDTVNKLQRPNSVRGLFADVVDTARLSGTRYYMFANPNEAPVIEVAFLNGVTEPQIEMQEAFTVDGTRYRARLDFGVAAIDYRGAVTNAGQ